MQVAVYAGVPAAVSALRVAAEVLGDCAEASARAARIVRRSEPSSSPIGEA